jgi:hypothetical protein
MKMSDLYNGFIITLDKPMKDEDAQTIMDCCKALRHVIKVEHIVDDIVSLIAKNQAKDDLKRKLFEVLY